MILTTCKIKRSVQDDLTESFPTVTFQFCSDIKEAEKYIEEAEVIVTYGEDLTDDHIDMAKKLKWIMIFSAGIDKMPFAAIKERNILMTNVRGIHKIPMAEYAISMILQVARNAKQLTENEKQHKWDRTVRMHEITGKTMLVVGAGAIGQEVARLGKAFQMKTIGVSRSGKHVEHFDEVVPNTAILEKLPEADFVISILPKTNETLDFFRREHFQAMKETAIFLNMGRGHVVNEEDLMEALRQNEIAHAILDVFKEEPLREDHPFWDMEQVTVTPHISGISRGYQPRSNEIFKQNLQEYLRGGSNYINVIDPDRGY